MSIRRAVAVAVAAATIGAAIGIAIPAPCVGDDGARCMTDAEYADVLARMDAIRSERSGDRFGTADR